MDLSATFLYKICGILLLGIMLVSFSSNLLREVFAAKMDYGFIRLTYFFMNLVTASPFKRSPVELLEC